MLLAQPAPTLDARELLRQYTNALRPFATQITKSDTIHEDTVRGQTIWARTTVELRRDNDRFDMIVSRWVRQKDRESLEKPELAERSRQMYDGERFFDGWSFGDGPGDVTSPRIMVSREWQNIDRAMGAGYVGSPLDGCFPGDDRNVAEIFARADTLEVQEAPESIGGAACYRLTATNENGVYVVWIDSSHGYNIARAEVHLNGQFTGIKRPPGLSPEAEEIARKYRLPEDTGMSFLLENVRFEKVGHTWVPMEADFDTRFEKEGGGFSETKRHHRRMSVDLSPDFAKAGAFVPNIPNGTKIEMPEFPGITFEWQDGQVGPSVDEEIISQVAGTIRQYKAEAGATGAETVRMAPDCSATGGPTVAQATGRSHFWRTGAVVAGVLVVGIVIWLAIGLQREHRHGKA